MEPVDLEQWWPQLFDGMSPELREKVIEAFAGDRMPDYDEVKDLCELATGVIDEAEYEARSLKQAQQAQRELPGGGF